MDHSGIPDSWFTNTFGYHIAPRRYKNSLSSYLSCALAGRYNSSSTTLVSEARSRVVHDRIPGYKYSFHPAGVVHLDSLEIVASRE